MIKIILDSKVSILGTLSMEVIGEVIRVLKILYENYGKYSLDGGYILILECKDDLKNMPMDLSEYEFADRIGNYISVLYLMGTEYSVKVIVPVDIAPQIIMKGLEK